MEWTRVVSGGRGLVDKSAAGGGSAERCDTTGIARAGFREMKRAFAYLGWMPLRMHRRRKSASLSCRRLSAWLRVV